MSVQAALLSMKIEHFMNLSKLTQELVKENERKVYLDIKKYSSTSSS